MISKRMKAVATVALALGLAFGGARVVSAQRGTIGVVKLGSDSSQLASISTNTLIAVETPEKDGVKVYSIEDGTWFEYRAPGGTRVRPLGFGNCIAIKPKGSKVTQLAVFSGQSNTWIKQDLKDYVVGELVPLMSGTIAVYFDGHRLYAFSALASRWAVLELPEGANEVPSVSERVATITHKDHLYIFNAKFGRWDDSGDRPK